MSYEVKIIEDSMYEGSRLTTFQLRYPRFIHSEFMTHRVFSRNASSSRAIPVKTMLKQVWSDPAMPFRFGANKSGMQSATDLSPFKQSVCRFLWKTAAKAACVFAWGMMKVGLHKQWANRVLEPFQYISVVCTSSDFSNFFELRCHPDAQPEIKHLAMLMRLEYGIRETSANELTTSEYHLPYVSHIERSSFSTEDCVKFSVARCARVSYLTHDGKKPSPVEDLMLYERLVGSRPLHASPAEHQARPKVMNVHLGPELKEKPMNGNFNDKWMQYRKFLEIDIAEEFFK